MGQWSKCYNCKNITDKCRIELCRKDNDDCDNFMEANDMNGTNLFNVVGIDDMEGTVFCRTTSLEKAQKAKAMLEQVGWEDILDIVQDEMPVDVVEIDGKIIEL